MDTRRWNELIDACDVAGLAEQLRSVGAGYLILTIGQNSGYYLAPNPTYDRLVGARRSRLARRDLVSDLSAALRERGVRLLSVTPWEDFIAGESATRRCCRSGAPRTAGSTASRYTS